MKALKPTFKNTFLFLVGLNVGLGLIFLLADIQLTLKLFAAFNFVGISIILNWLPKTSQEMDERESILCKNLGDTMFGFTMIIFLSVFMIHLIFYPEMKVTEFMTYAGMITTLGMSYKSMKLRKELT